MSVKYSYLDAGFPVVDLPRCKCGGDFVMFSVDVAVDGGQVVLVGHVACDDCGAEPPFCDSGSDSQSWREAVLRCVNAWSSANGGPLYPSIAALPDDLDELVDYAEGRFGALPDYRAEILARHRSRRLN